MIAIELPDTVELPIVETMPGVRGNSATGRTKPATLSTGYIVQVPEHLDQGETVRVDTRTGEYLGRSELRASRSTNAAAGTLDETKRSPW